jgi:hypothetical protein
MNKINFTYILLLLLAFMQCRPAESVDPLTTQNKKILAFANHALDVPLSTVNGFTYIRNDFNLINITTEGEEQVLNNLSNYFPSLGSDALEYNYLYLRHGETDNDLFIYGIVEDSATNKYTQCVFLNTDLYGSVKSSHSFYFPPVDSIKEVDTTYKRKFVDLKYLPNSVIVAFTLTKNGPQNESYLEFLKYSDNNTLVTDTLFVLGNGVSTVLKFIQSDNLLYVFQSKLTTQGQGVELKTYDFNFNLKESITIEGTIAQINYEKELSNGNFLIAGMDAISPIEGTTAKNFMVELTKHGQIVWQKTNFSMNYLFYYDVIEVDGGFVACGLYSFNQEYPDWSTIAQVQSTAFFVGTFNQTSDNVAWLNSSKLGSSVGVAIKKTDTGYSLLSYMSLIDDPITEDYLWLYKLNNDLHIQ